MAAMFNDGRPIQNVFQVSQRALLSEESLLLEEMREASLADFHPVHAGFAGALALILEVGADDNEL